MMAKQRAQDFFDEHDGWECEWPIKIYLHETEDGPEIAKVFVELEAEPVFYARIMK